MLKNKKAKSQAASKDIPDELPTQKLKDMVTSRSFVFYGRSGTGKTTLACSFPGPGLLLDVKDRGTDSVSDIEGFEGMSIEDWDDFEMVYYYLKKNRKRYKTVIIDTMSQLQELAIKKVLTDNKKDSARAGHWGTMTKKEWGETSGLLKDWIINYRDLNDIGIEVVFIAQDRTFNKEEDDESQLDPEIGPRLMPSVASHLNAAVHVVGNTFIKTKTVVKEVKGKKIESEKKIYCLRVGPNPVYITKVRKPKSIIVPDVISNPDYDSIIETIKGE